MGVRGPLPALVDHAGKSRPGATEVLRAGSLPDRPPSDLGPAGRAVWRDAGRCAWVQITDRPTVLGLARLEDERHRLSEERDATGLLLTEPVQNARGDVIGTRQVGNPLTPEIRRCERLAAELRSALGLHPTSRTRMGLRLVDAEQRSVVTQLLMDKYKAAAVPIASDE